ncbi:MAG: sigma-70 family RNA polymerase sigma factor [Lentisphaerae bacterium]|nr:sigma-70 family RNA polymerase sigma factor [Lentisphaerota bacterium]
MSTPAAQSKSDRVAAFEAVVAAYESALLRYVARIVHDESAAQDVVQDTFIRLLGSWKDRLEPSPRLSGWLYRVAHNRAVDWLRKESRRRLLHRNQAQERRLYVPPDRGPEFALSDAAVRAAEALKGLSLREQQLVILKVYEEKSYREISEITGLSVGNVGYILHHAMKKLARACR